MTETASEHVYKGIEKLGLAVQILLASVTVLTVWNTTLGCFILLNGRSELSRLAWDIQTITGSIQAVVYVCTGVTFLVWQRRAFRNLSALKATGMQNKEWYCIWGFFIPIANFKIPMSVLNETWKASDPALLDSTAWKKNGNSGLIIGWWIAWLCFGIPNLLNTLFNTGKQKLEVFQLLQTPAAYLILQTVYCIAAVLLILSVRQVCARQKQKHELLGKLD